MRLPNSAFGRGLLLGLGAHDVPSAGRPVWRPLSANDQYAASVGAKSELALPPARRFAILTCMDARLDPAKYAGLSEGDAHVIRNAGGRASDDAIRSLVISYKRAVLSYEKPLTGSRLPGEAGRWRH